MLQRPGCWHPGENRYLIDETALGRDTGNLAWAGIALVQAEKLLRADMDRNYLQTALEIGHEIVMEHRVDDLLGGFGAGYETRWSSADNRMVDARRSYRSTEHNINLVVLFNHLANAVDETTLEGRAWRVAADHAEQFVISMRSPEGYYFIGTIPAGAHDEYVTVLWHLRQT